jgi:hypothetical protein
VSSILSKKLAEGVDGLVLDVKCGSGAFMKTLPEARALARAMVDGEPLFPQSVCRFSVLANLLPLFCFRKPFATFLFWQTVCHFSVSANVLPLFCFRKRFATLIVSANVLRKDAF